LAENNSQRKQKLKKHQLKMMLFLCDIENAAFSAVFPSYASILQQITILPEVRSSEMINSLNIKEYFCTLKNII